MTIVNWYRCTGCGSANQTNKSLDATSSFLCEACEAKGVTSQADSDCLPPYIREPWQRALQLAANVTVNGDIDRAIQLFEHSIDGKEVAALLTEMRQMIHGIDGVEWKLIGIELEYLK